MELEPSLEASSVSHIDGHICRDRKTDLQSGFELLLLLHYRTPGKRDRGRQKGETEMKKEVEKKEDRAEGQKEEEQREMQKDLETATQRQDESETVNRGTEKVRQREFFGIQ